MKLGDTVEYVLSPIAKALKLFGCLGCQKRKEKLNKLFNARKAANV